MSDALAIKKCHHFGCSMHWAQCPTPAAIALHKTRRGSDNATGLGLLIATVVGCSCRPYLARASRLFRRLIIAAFLLRFLRRAMCSPSKRKNRTAHLMRPDILGFRTTVIRYAPIDWNGIQVVIGSLCLFFAYYLVVTTARPHWLAPMISEDKLTAIRFILNDASPPNDVVSRIVCRHSSGSTDRILSKKRQSNSESIDSKAKMNDLLSYFVAYRLLRLAKWDLKQINQAVEKLQVAERFPRLPKGNRPPKWLSVLFTGKEGKPFDQYLAKHIRKTSGKHHSTFFSFGDHFPNADSIRFEDELGQPLTDVALRDLFLKITELDIDDVMNDEGQYRNWKIDTRDLLIS